MDSGHLFARREILPIEEARAGDEWTWKFIDRLPMDAIHFTLQDSAFMNDVLTRKIAVQAGKLAEKGNLVSTNLTLKNKRIPLPWKNILYLQKEIPGFRKPLNVAVLGLTDVAASYPLDLLEVEEPSSALLRTLAEARNKADLVILLTDLPATILEGLIRSHPGIDLVLRAHRSAELNPVRMVEETAIVESSDQGKFLGEMALYLDKNLSLDRLRNRFVELNSSIPDPTSLVPLIQEAEQSMDELRILLNNRTDR